jgi:hypothetical protein
MDWIQYYDDYIMEQLCFTDEELEGLFDIWGYETPLYGMFQTGDEIPLEIIYAGLIGLLCLILYAILGKHNI